MIRAASIAGQVALTFPHLPALPLVLFRSRFLYHQLSKVPTPRFRVAGDK